MNKKERLQLAYANIDNHVNYDNYYKSDKDAEFAFTIQDKNLYIYCIQSNSTKDYFINFYCFSENTEYGRFQKGYFQECDKFIYYLSKYVDYSKIENIFIDGYSYGGGTCAILTCRFGNFIENMRSYKLGNFSVKQCSGVAIEGPKAINRRADKILKTYTHTELYSVVSSNDLVTKVPFNFIHGGTYCHIGDKRKWYKFDLIAFPFYYNKDRRSIYKFFTITSHEHDDLKTKLKKYIEEL